MKTRGLAFLALIFAATMMFGQRMPTGQELEEGKQSYLLYEAIVAPGTKGSTAQILLPVRIDKSFFVAERGDGAPIDSPFVRRGELLIEILDSAGTSVARSSKEIETASARAESDPLVHEWIQESASFTVPPGTYHILVDLNDLQSKRSHDERQVTVKVPQANSSLTVTGSLFFCSGLLPEKLSDTLSLVNAGSDFLFGTKGFAVFSFLPLADTSTYQLSYRLEEVVPHERDIKVISRDHVPAEWLHPNSSLTLIESHGSDVQRCSVHHDGPWTLGLIPVQLGDLPLRDYRITVEAKTRGTTQEIHGSFRMIWPDMPGSLKNVEMAIEALRFLAPTNAIDRWRKGDFEAQRDSLEGFWKGMARNSGGTSSALMLEYYRRYDHALKTYGTLRSPDGTRTDRGKIYVLYGPPTNADRRLNPSGAFEEVWDYAKHARRFVFEDSGRNGNYVLVSSTGS